MLSAAVALECYEPVAGRRAQIIQRAYAVQQQQLSPRLPLDPAKARDIFVVEEPGRR
jgi:hypothetical protein